MKIAISYPPIESSKGKPTLGQNRQFQWFLNPTYIYPMVPASAASLLKQNGYEVFWDDGIAEELSYREWLARILKQKPDIIAIETKTPVIKRHWEIIKELKNQSLKIENYKLKILHGCEANIMADGSIDISDEALAELDYVIAGVHSQLKMNKNEMTKRIIRAMKNPNVDIISHPTGRILQKREEYKIDFDEILKVAKETGAILEINASPYRLDLKDANIRRAKQIGVKMIINTDSHQEEQMYFMEYGVSQSRRGWAEKGDIINTKPLAKLLGFLK